MFDNGVVAAATVAATVIISIFFWMKRSGTKDDQKRYPPTASVLSLLWNALRGGMGILPDHFMRVAEKLGPVISYNFGGGSRVVILNGKEAISEAFLKQSEAFADRIQFWTETNILNRDCRGILFAGYTDAFKKYHKLSLAILKEFGFGVNSVSETRILHEVELLKEKILKFNGRPFYPKALTCFSTFSVVSCMIFGEKFMMSDSCHRISEAVNQFTRNLGVGVDFAPFLRFLPFFRRKISALLQGQEDMFTSIKEGIECSKSVQCETTFVKRFIEIQGPDYDQQDLLYIVRDLCLASVDTVSTTLQFAFIELANHPDIQKRFQREIDDVIPKDRLPSLDDKPHLPYTEAVILEVMRRRTMVPMYIPHATFKDAKIFGCYIPKGCMVIGNAYSAHMDPKLWKDPGNFRPERFLDERNEITGSDQVLPFGLGKRSCLGEILGRQKVFLYLTSLIQRFDIRPPEGQELIKVKEIVAMAVFPSEFQMRMIPRIEDQGIKK